MSDQRVDLERLGKISVFDEFEHSVLLADLWREHRAVLVFVRHFG